MATSHHDAFGRIKLVRGLRATRDHYLRPSDGRLVPLRVQGYGQTNEQRPWVRTGTPQTRMRAILDLVYWTYDSVLEKGSDKRHYDDGAFILALKWIPCCILLVLMLLVPQNLEGNARNGGYYEPIQYRDWRYAKISRNAGERYNQNGSDDHEPGESARLLDNQDVEMANLSQHLPAPTQDAKIDEIDKDFDDLPARHFRPRFLCFLQQSPHGGPVRCETRNVEEWLREHGEHASTEFVFLSYTRKQFCLGAEGWFKGKPQPDQETWAKYDRLAEEDRATLLEYGIRAAREANKSAFWVDFECIRDADNVARVHAQSNDVYRICDIVRAAHSLVILVGPSPDDRVHFQPQPFHPSLMNEWLRVWGERLWTLPEVLLCPNERRIKLYGVGDPNPPEEIAKRNLPSRAVWHDAKQVRELVDHYESSIHLTSLELVSIALECFSHRQTFQFNNGDISYALMGLLRRRPRVVDSDTGFEAFARLSLANDSDRLLERLIGMEPTRSGAPWNEIKDAWGARLWDIEPRCQVAGIADDETVTLDGAFGATIQWDAVEQVAFLKRPTFGRTLGKILLRGAPGYLITGLAMTIAAASIQSVVPKSPGSGNSQLQYPNGGDSDNDTSKAFSGVSLALLIIGLLILIPGAIITLAAPAMLLNIYRGKFWSTQAHFVGIEGIPSNIGEVERLLFGFDHGRLKWSVAGSTLSRHRLSKNGEIEALPPGPPPQSKANQPYSENRAGRLAHQSGGLTLFTLIDTYAMTATAFYAARPPTTVIVCGHEGGMQRAVLCSYNWWSGTFVRESVIRVRTMVLDRMFRVDRFRFALRAKESTADGQLPVSDPSGYAVPDREQELEDIEGKSPYPWKKDLALLPFMWVVNALPSTIIYLDESTIVIPVVFYVGYLLAQVLNYITFPRMPLGRIIAAATLIKSVLFIVQMFVKTGAALIPIALFAGVASGVQGPALVYLTGAWYEGERGLILHVIIWASGGVFYGGLSGVLYQWTGNLPVDPFALTWAVVCILLSVYAVSSIGLPGQTRWLSSEETSWMADTRKRTSSNAIRESLKRPETYFFALVFFFVAMFDSTSYGSGSGLSPDVFFALYYVCPVVLSTTLAAVLFLQVPLLRIMVVVTVVILAFSGKLNAALKDFASAGTLFLNCLSSFSVYFTWGLLLASSAFESQSVATLSTAFSASSLGSIIIGALRASPSSGIKFTSGEQESAYDSSFTYKGSTRNFVVLLSVVFALLVSTLISWGAYEWYRNRKPDGRGEEPLNMTVTQQQQTVDDSYHPSYDYPIYPVRTDESQVPMQSYEYYYGDGVVHDQTQQATGYSSAYGQPR
ncbi:hypothetical protein F4778DRAFT_731692 [Xylariomycetidae sp. FL2044]|nr:hypothetical protein F4778DRAFT_731692 [Xylariomycetidae sp. FL2044]